MDVNWDGYIDMKEYAIFITIDKVKEHRSDFEAAVSSKLDSADQPRTEARLTDTDSKD